MTNSASILLVEDDRGYAMIFKHAVKDSEIANSLVHLNDCREALEYLNDRSNERPCLIIADLNIPGMNGFEFLKILKSAGTLMAIPVIILSGSLNEQDMAEGRELGAADYIVKPDDYKELVVMLGNLHKYLVSDELLNCDIG